MMHAELPAMITLSTPAAPSTRAAREGWYPRHLGCFLSGAPGMGQPPTALTVGCATAEYGPTFVEWINDSSCNVLFADPHTAKRAIFGLGKPLPPADIPEGQGALKPYKFED